MRILRIADVPDNRTGGMSRAMHGTGEALHRRGHQVDYFFSEQLPFGGPARLRRFLMPLKLPRLVRRLKASGRCYDIVEIHEPLAAPYCFTRRRERDLPPVVIFSHGLEERGQQAEMDYRKKKGLAPPGARARVSGALTWQQAAYAVRHADHVLCCNSQDVAHLRRAGVAARRLTQHHNAVGLEFLEEGERLARQQPPRSGVLFLGSWILRKGTLDLVPAMSRVLNGDSSAHFTIAGCGVDTPDVLREFEKYLHPQITVIPRIEGSRHLMQVYGQHSVFVLPSYFEGQPLVMLEAAALGLAIITTDICGMADFIETGRNGLSVPVGDVDALQASICSLIGDEDKARALGQAAQSKARGYTWDNSAARIEAAYEQARRG